MKETCFPVLYKKAKNNKTSKWCISVEIDKNDIPVIIRKSGFIGYKERVNNRYIKKGTNIGRSNEKTPYENALFIAENFWKDHIKDNWIDDIDKIDEEPLYLKPMLAKTFKPEKCNDWSNIIVQPKYNGIRAISYLHRGDERLLSRECKEHVVMNHIKKEFDIFNNLSPDGELYKHDLTFQEIVRRVKKYREGLTEEIEYWVYDLAIPDKTFSERYSMLKKIVNNNSIIKLVPVYNVDSYEEFKKYHDQFVSEGFEGIIVRDKTSYYQFNDRPKCLQKYKEFFDNEFEVIGYKKEEWDDNGTIKNLVIWVCKTDNDETFDVRPKGSFLVREQQYNDVEQYMNKMLTVRYQEKSENGTPIFGVGIEFRDYE